MNRWDFLSAMFSATAFVLTLQGTIFPYWWIVKEHDVDGKEWTFHYGIWVIVTCVPDNCVTTSSRMKDDRAWLLGPAVLLIFANVVLLLSAVYVTVCLFTKRYNKTLRRLAIVFCCGAGGTIILAVLIFYKKKAGLRPSIAPETTDGDPEWALFLATGGGILALCNSVFIGFGFKRNAKPRQEDSVFGMKKVADFEIDVNALRKGVLIQGRNITRINSEKSMSDSEISVGKFTALP